jgi:DNA-binding response OmpR family regulator
MSLPVLKTILVLEDEPLLLKFVETILERDGYSVLTAASPTEAIRINQDSEIRIDLLLTAFFLLPSSCSDLAARLQRCRPGLRVMLMSSDLAAPILARAKGWSFVTKPFTSSDLLNRIRKVLALDVAMPVRYVRQSALWDARFSAGAGGGSYARAWRPWNPGSNHRN